MSQQSNDHEENAMNNLNRSQAETLGDQIADWNIAWDAAEQRGDQDSMGGMEWRHGLMNFLALSEEQRQDWLNRSAEWQQRNLYDPDYGLNVSDPLTGTPPGAAWGA